ncbi:YfiT family bacillithiol transferase [Aquimarina brevivitae]|uniref:DinB family protein n=1 Tax=Aquimarina brevivitae TaxID=323412 RepID=A0A4Q7P0F4_9FLAO|nr:putative metal-dependent hydrolase [Aquimarina brevivitae]RZS93155.1 DinB family protein [Aquimarina brevivitae]
MPKLNKLQYPIGTFSCPDLISEELLRQWIASIETLPERIEKLIRPFNEKDWAATYRPGGWNARQLVHHIHDSHHNGYIRFKWAMTEDTPVIKAYNEQSWAELFDSKSAPVELSLNLIKALHAKWVYFLKGLSLEDDLQRAFIHPEGNVTLTLAEDIGIYAWHGEHHLAHLQLIADR